MDASENTDSVFVQSLSDPPHTFIFTVAKRAPGWHIRRRSPPGTARGRTPRDRPKGGRIAVAGGLAIVPERTVIAERAVVGNGAAAPAGGCGGRSRRPTGGR